MSTQFQARSPRLNMNNPCILAVYKLQNSTQIKLFFLRQTVVFIIQRIFEKHYMDATLKYRALFIPIGKQM